jgi:mRNA interferase RelE/StbE
MLPIELQPAARRFLETLPPKQFRQVVRKIFALADDPAPSDSRLLKGYPFRRADAGEYRIIYDLAECGLRVVLVGKRNDDDVYRRLR